MTTVGLTEARYSLKKIVRRASAGETFILTERGRKKAAVVPLSLLEENPKESTRAFMRRVTQLQKEITCELRMKGFNKSSVELIREMREER